MRTRKIVITTGDVDGVGLEVAAKALKHLGPRPGVQFILVRSPKTRDPNLASLHRKFKVRTFTQWQDVLDQVPSHKKELWEVTPAAPPARWIEWAAAGCLHRQLDALVTGPLSKPEIQRTGLKDLGHTDILKRMTRTSRAWMSFVGRKFNVFLLSGHQPVTEVERSLTPDSIRAGLRAAHSFYQELGVLNAKRPLGVVGLNPHAGDEGLIGSFDGEVLTPVLRELQKEGLHLEGPLMPDVAFQKSRWKKYAAFVACYHDQGLIPFKLVHGHESGVHVTVGIPILRTSVDHGTAKDIYGKNKAEDRSMREAIQLAIQLSRQRMLNT